MPPRARAGLERALDAAAHEAPRRPLAVHASLTRQDDPAVARPVVAKAAVELAGRVVRAHVAAPTESEAIGLLESRLKHNLHKLAERDAAEHRGRSPVARRAWSHADLRPPRPSYRLLPAAERRIVRHKVYPATPMTVAEAAAEMVQLDHDFHLFVDRTTGRDALVHARPDGTLVLRGGGHDDVAETPFLVDPDPPQVIAVEAAIERLNRTDEPFLFFVDETSGRGSVLYHRYDGHYGLVAPEGREAARAG